MDGLIGKVGKVTDGLKKMSKMVTPRSAVPQPVPVPAWH